MQTKVFDKQRLTLTHSVGLLALAGLLWSAPLLAQEPAWGQERITLEAKVAPELVLAPETIVSLCVHNVNHRTAPGLALIDQDSWTFRVEGICGSVAPVTTCDADLSVLSTSVSPTDFTCVVGGDTVLLTYTGTPQPLAYDERVCIDVRYSPAAQSCALEFRFRPRQTSLGPYAAEGIGRVNQPPTRTFYTLSMEGSGPQGPTGPTGPIGPRGAI